MEKTTYYDTVASGKRIAQSRKAVGYTQQQLAEILNMHKNSLSEIERGVRGTSIDTLMEICIHLNVSIDYILFGMRNKERNLSIQQRLTQLTQRQLEYVEKVIDFSMEYIK